MSDCTTEAVGEEDPTPITTLALGEETPPTDVPHWAEDGPSTRAYGEEGEQVRDLPIVGDPFGGF